MRIFVFFLSRFNLLLGGNVSEIVQSEVYSKVVHMQKVDSLPL